jgi:hypothetical protein
VWKQSKEKFRSTDNDGSALVPTLHAWSESRFHAVVESPIPTTPGHAEPKEHAYAFGLTEGEVLRLQDILRRECNVELTLDAAWARAIELVALARTLAEADLSANVRL